MAIIFLQFDKEKSFKILFLYKKYYAISACKNNIERYILKNFFSSVVIFEVIFPDNASITTSHFHIKIDFNTFFGSLVSIFQTVYKT